jgi:predicted AAA+ superfamily ATPase
LLSGMNPFHHTFSFEPKVISYYENGKKAHPRGVCQSDKDTPLHSFHFQKIKKFVFLKVGDYMKTITRTKYLDRIIELNGTPDIKIITGIRRSGKSKLMQAYIEYLKSNFENINIIFIDFMDLAYEEIMEYHALHAYVEEHYQEGKTNYLFVDEVQMCPNFELAINSLYSKGIYDIYVTGSNAFLLSADLATLFTGRYIEIHVFPFSFQEYCQYYDDVSDKDKLFDDYTIKGGLAGSYAYRTEKDRTNYIKEVYETIVTRDLVQKYALPDTLVLQRLSEFLMDNISNLTSPNKVSQLLTANETPTNHVTVGKYIKYLCNAFVFYDIKRYDIRGKKYLESSEKFYLCDSGIRYAILGSRNMDYGRVYENIVCIELLRRGYDVYVGKLYQKEIDFVAQRGSEKFYIQVSDNISGQEIIISVHFSFSSLIILVKSSTPFVSNAFNGSSKIKISGFSIIAAAIPSSFP